MTKLRPKRRHDLSGAMKPTARAWTHPCPIRAGIWPDQVPAGSCLPSGLMTMCRSSGEAIRSTPERPGENSSRATGPSSEPFPSSQTLEWTQELDRQAARPTRVPRIEVPVQGQAWVALNDHTRAQSHSAFCPRTTPSRIGIKGCLGDTGRLPKLRQWEA